MNCKACDSYLQRTFTGEIAIHFPGLEASRGQLFGSFRNFSVP